MKENGCRNVIITKYLQKKVSDLGSVVQSIVSLTTSLRRQLVKYMPTNLSNTLLFFCRKNVRIFCAAKDSHIFLTKNNSVFVIFTFENLTKR